jgi:uncharacterized protein (TIGR02996 family)
MANAKQLEIEALERLSRAPNAEDAKAARSVLEAPPYKSELAVPFLRLSLAVLAIEGDSAWLDGLAKKIARWPKTWARDWYLRQIAATQAVIARLEKGPAKPKPLAAGTKPHAQWLSRASKQSAGDLPELLRDFLDGPATQIAERAAALLPWPKDPRIAEAALAARRGKLVSDPLHALWPALENLFAVHAGGALRKEVAVDPALAAPRWISERRGGPDASAPAPAKPGAVPKTAAEWEAWSLAAPDDLARRALWADWLLERGDPRGELMMLQLLERELTPKEQGRVNALVKKHGRAWLGTVGQIAEQRGLRFERGVAVAVSLKPVPDGRVVDDDPNWATVRELEIPEQAPPPKVDAKLFELLPRLTSLQGAHMKIAQRVFAAGAPCLRRISFALDWGNSPLDAKLLPVFLDAKLPALRAARLHAWPEQARQLRDAAWFQGLEHVAFTRGDLRAWLWLLERPKLQRVELLGGHSFDWAPGPNAFSFLMAREGKGWSLRIVGIPEQRRTPSRLQWYEDVLWSQLQGIPRATFGNVTLEVPANYGPMPPSKTWLSGWLKPRPG